ncbi:MAG: hypothetical protein IJM50_02435 [Lachnospiraceae bacterium]|nr:hypothetical protein [Lachnospiraceae bacterium]
MKKIVHVVAVLTVIVLVAYAFVRGGSYDRALRKAGMSRLGHGGYLVHYGKDAEDNDYLVRFAPEAILENGQVMTIALFLNRPFWGWRLERRVVSRLGDTSVMLTYGRPSNAEYYGYEKHVIYAGNNAVSEIESLTDVLPPNVTVDIISYPGSAYYCLHFMSYDDYEIAPESLLRQKGYIK